MNGKVRLGILFGGRSGEHDVSLMSARSVLSVLDPQKYEVTLIGITQQGTWVTGTNPGGDSLLEILQACHTAGIRVIARTDLRSNRSRRGPSSPGTTPSAASARST